MAQQTGIDGNLKEFVLREYDTSWDHYRHAETMRSQHLGFFFTIAFAFLAYAGTTTESAIEDPWQSVLLAALAFLITILACLTFISVRKLGVVLGHYETVIRRIRARVLEAHPDLSAMFVPDKHPPERRVFRSRLFTVQGAAEVTLVVCAVTATCVEIALAGYFFAHEATTIVRALLGGQAAVSVLIVGALLIAGKKPYYVMQP